MEPDEEVRLGAWFVVIPVKGGLGAKSRLTGTGRLALAEAMARDTAAVAADALGDPGRVVVVTSDEQTADWVCRAAHLLVPDPARGLDEAARAGAGAALKAATGSPAAPAGALLASPVGGGSPERGGPAVAVLLGDHPALTPDELREVLAAAEHSRHAFVADAEGTGTALVTSTVPGDLRCGFGPGSAQRHRALGLVALDLPCPGLRLDVDDDEDLARALRLGVGARTARAALGYARDHAGDDPLRDP